MRQRFLLAAMTAFAATALANSGSVEKYVVKTHCAEQTIENFGASDAWSMRFVGLWNEAEQKKAADWLFSTETDSKGRPLGIGLSLWRFNLGAGSAEQGEASQIKPGTRTECFLQPDGSYDWTRQEGQRRFLRLAKERGVPYFLAFLNSAPVHFTENGLATNTGRGGTINLKPDCFDDFARFIATSLQGIEQHDGVHFDYISPVNEPDGSWNWQGPKQEGSPATNAEIARLVRELDRELTRKKLNTRILVTESSDLRCLVSPHQAGWTRGNELRTFFSKDSAKTYLGRLKHVEPVIAAHSYWTNTPVEYMRQIREQLRDSLKALGLGYWQTELCIMGNDAEIGYGRGYDFSMKTALYVARVIHNDLVFGNARCWQWWRAIGEDYKDGLLRAYTTDSLRSGFIVDSKLLWALGNYSRFVRPGAVRYDMSAFGGDGKEVKDGCNDARGVMCSAYRNKSGQWVVVAINYSEAVKPFCLSVDDGGVAEWKAYRTSDVSSESLAPIGTTDGNASLAPRSVTTFVSER